MPIHISKDTVIKILLLMVIALAVRLIHFEHTTFGYDQARDGFMALEIFGKDPIKLIGPSTDIGGLFMVHSTGILFLPLIFFRKVIHYL